MRIIANNLPDKIEEDWMRKLWDKIQEANANKEDKGKAPLIELDLDKPKANLEIQSRYNMAEPYHKSSSKALMLRNFHSFLEMMRIMLMTSGRFLHSTSRVYQF